MKTILVVDDNKLNLASARKVLSDKYRVIPVMKGQQALSYLENGECDIILLDINMPEMDGFEVMGEIQKVEKWRDIPVVFLTADNDAETETRCFREGAQDFIAKPFVPDVMLSRIGRILELEDLRRSLAEKLEQKTKEVSDIKSKSHHDALTGLWDRIYTEEKVNGILERRTKGALMMIDLDNFKAVNDNYGHIAGDKVLKMLADSLREFSTDRDVLCRLGGDEFVVFIADKFSKNELSSRATDIIFDFRLRLKEGGFETNSSVSIGIAQAPEDGTEFVKLYNSADKALYHVKQNGKNSYHFFGDKLQAENTRLQEPVDVRYLQEMISGSDNSQGSYFLDFESFHYVYNFICRFIERNDKEFQTLLFTINEKPNVRLNGAELEYIMRLLERVISSSLRRLDVSTRYSSRQLIVVIVGASSENGSMVAERIIANFNELYIEGKVDIDYSVATMLNHRKDT